MTNTPHTAARRHEAQNQNQTLTLTREDTR